MSMESNQQRDFIYLAALLHDIGKFYQRADPTGYKKSNLLSNPTKNLISVHCPYSQKNNDWTHKHVLWTYQFFEDFKNKFNQVLENSNYGRDQNREGLARLSAAHHNPLGINEKLIQKADHWSSGVDRTKGKGWEDAENELHNLLGYKGIRMRSIFEGLKREEPGFSWEYNLPVEPLTLDKEFFPQHQDEFSKPPDYGTQWQHFIDNVQHLPTGNIRAFTESLRSLLELYTSTVPGSTQHLSDVSLYDHLKTTAAIALCFNDYFKEKNNLQQVDLAKGEEAMLLIGGDVSGVQKFIYDIISRNAAKNLKGRSFYLQVLVESIVQRLLDAFNLYSSNVIYSSGGTFFLLAPNTKLVRGELERLEYEFGEQLFQSHETNLFVALDKVGISEGIILPQAEDEQQLSDKWQELINKLNKKKQKRHQHQIREGYARFFEPLEQGGNQDRDAITQEEIDSEAPPKIEDANGRKLPINEATNRQIKMGKALKDTQQWLVVESPLNTGNEALANQAYNPDKLGVYHYFLSKNADVPDKAGLKAMKFNLSENLLNGENDKAANGFAFYGGNQFPIDNKGEPKTFDDLAGPETLGFRRLGVLRMDVDDLGQAFVNGFQKGRRTFSRYSALSRNLDYFFKGYLNKLWEEGSIETPIGSVENYRDYTYIIYSGGDDLFIVGKWDVLIAFAEDIQIAFKQWTCHNPELSLSGGMALVNPKFPIAKSAELAAEGEEQAKAHSIPLKDNKGNEIMQDKNALTFMHYPMNWDYEFPKINDVKNAIKDLAKDETLPKSFFTKIQAHHEAYQVQRQPGKVESWQWLMAYDLNRMQNRLKGREVHDFLERVKTDVFSNTWHGKNELNSAYPFLLLLTIATIWADLELRQ